MFRLVFRSLGLWCFAGAFVAALIDGMKSIAAGRLVVTVAATTWGDLAPASLKAARVFVETRAGPVVWESAAVALSLPTWALLGIVAAVLIVATRPARPKIGVVP